MHSPTPGPENGYDGPEAVNNNLPSVPSMAPPVVETTPVPEVCPTEVEQRALHRKKVAQEICSTEASYVESLDNLVNIVKPEFEKTFDEDSLVLFSNLPILLSLNQKLSESFKTRTENWTDTSCICDLFLTFTPYLKMYSQYVSNHDNAQDLIATLQSKKSDKFEKFSTVFMNNPALRGQDLNSYLIMPIQRIPRYRLLLAELLKRTPEDHPDYKDNEKALEVVSAVALTVNEAIRAQQARMNLINIQKQFSSHIDIFSPTRHLVHQGLMFKQCRKYDVQYEFFLFNDFLIYASRNAIGKLKLHRKIDIVHGFSVADVPDGEKKNCFLIINPSKSFLVYTNTPDEKKKWMESIEQTSKNNNITSTLTIAPVWQSDKDSTCCPLCSTKFTMFLRRHHCRICGILCCADCSKHRVVLNGFDSKQRACDNCITPTTPNKIADHNAALSAANTTSVTPLPNVVVPEKRIEDESDTDSDTDSDSESLNTNTQPVRNPVRPPIPARTRKPLGYLKYIAKAPFYAATPRDLDIEVGDSINVYQNDPSGWSLGRNIRTRKAGIFPNIVVDEDVAANLYLVAPKWCTTGITVASKAADPGHPTAMGYEKYDYICVSTKQDDGWCYALNLSDEKEGWIYSTHFTTIMFGPEETTPIIPEKKVVTPIVSTPVKVVETVPNPVNAIASPNLVKPQPVYNQVTTATPVAVGAPAIPAHQSVGSITPSHNSYQTYSSPNPTLTSPVASAGPIPIPPTPNNHAMKPKPEIAPKPNTGSIQRSVTPVSNTSGAIMKCSEGGCDCKNFQPHMFKKNQCKECFHSEDQHHG